MFPATKRGPMIEACQRRYASNPARGHCDTASQRLRSLNIHRTIVFATNYLPGKLKSQWLQFVICLSAAAALLTGCASPRAYVKAIQDPYYVLTPHSRLAVVIDENGSVQEKQLGTFLVARLRTQGFNVVSGSDSKFTLMYGIAENSSTTALWLNAYKTADLGGEQTKTIWRGYISVGADEFQKDPAGVVRTLLTYFGQEFRGSVLLVRNP